MKVTVRPVDVWPGKVTEFRHTGPFQSTYTQTADLLRREVASLTPPGRLHANDVVVQLYVTEAEIRLDGALRASARPSEPGVIVSFESKHGPLRYHTDRFRHWHDNLRAIALGLEALRKIDRYGISSAGEQYAGWQAIGPGQDPEAPLTVEAAARLLIEAAYPDVGERATFEFHQGRVAETAHHLWKIAAKLHHPDVGGDPAIFRRLTEARDLRVAQP